jgi:hypothetical protein
MPEKLYARTTSEEGAVTTAPTSTVRAAAEYAAEAFAPDEVEKHAQAIMDAIEARLKEQTRKYIKEAMAQKEKAVRAVAGGEQLREKAARGGVREDQQEVAGPIGQPLFFPPYPWFELLCAGPFQLVPGPVIPATGPFLPHKVIRANEFAFMIGILWRNSGGINWDPFNPSAAAVMSGMNFTVWFEPINLTNVTNVPAGLGPFTFNPIGPGPLNLFLVPMPPGTFPTPQSGRAHLYEINMTVDVTGPGPTVASLPFSGFSTWLFDPDQEPPVFPPPITPGVPSQLQHDVPARFLVHV